MTSSSPRSHTDFFAFGLRILRGFSQTAKSAALHLPLTIAIILGLGVCAGARAQGAVQAAQQSAPKLQPAPSQEPPELLQAKSLTAHGDLNQAETGVRAFLQSQGGSAEGHFLLGYILFLEIQGRAGAKSAMYYQPSPALAKFRDDRARASLAEFTEGAKYAKPSEFDLKIVAFDYVLLNDPADADKWLSRAVEWNPKDADAWYNLARTKYTENRFEEAIRAFQECLKLDPKNVKAEDNLGLSYYGLGRADDALAAYNAAIEWQTNATEKDPEPFIDLGTLYLEQNRPADALPYLREATQIAPEDAKGHEKLGKAFSQLDKFPEAQTELEKAVALAPDVASLHYMLGQVYRKEGMNDKAKGEFDKTAALNGTHSSDQKPMQ